MLMLASRNVCRRTGMLAFAAIFLLTTTSHATMLDLTAENASGEINGAKFMQYTTADPAGSGALDSFLRVHGDDVEAGVNILDPLEFDTKAGAFTQAIQIADVPSVIFDGIEYLELLLDINEPRSSERYLSLDALAIHLADSGDITGYPGSFAPAVYDLDAGGDNWVKLDCGLAPGSGGVDMIAFIPAALFGSDQSKYIYLYSLFGENEPAHGGFEEWAVGDGGKSVYVPEPATLAFLVASGAFWALQRRRSG